MVLVHTCSLLLTLELFSTEGFWEAMHDLVVAGRFSSDDQVRFNTLLKKWNVKWSMPTPHASIPMVGRAGTSSLKIVLLPEVDICRVHCDPTNLSHYHVWHPRLHLIDDRVIDLQKQGLWFLRKDWNLEGELLNEGKTIGFDWLRSLVNKTAVKSN